MIGQTVSHYKILEKIGEGGMGAVYLAEETSLGRKVALKFLSADKAANPESRKRFAHEARAQAMLSHPNIATFHEVGEEGDKVFIVMEYIEGQKLSDLANVEPLSLSEILDITIQIGEGLSAAHERGVMHRDINPTNILVTSKGVPKITDFGLAKWKGASTITGTGLQMGTDHYMSPEQLGDGKKVDFRTDIFSYGVVLYELICGHRPFEGENRDSIYYEILHTQPHPLARFCRGVPEALEQVVFKCLAKKPEERYQSMADLMADLKSIKRKVDSGKTSFQLERVGRRTFRSILRRAAFPLAGVVVVLAGLYWLPGSRRLFQQFLGMRTFPLPENLVILPFTNVGGDPANQALCDGLGEAVNRKLSQLEKWQASLRVVPGSDVRTYRVYTKEDARKIFGATLAVKGNVEGTGRGVRLTLELVDTRGKRLKPLRSAVAEYTMANVTTIPEWTVRKLAEMLKIKLPPQTLRELATGGSSVSSASLSYFRGRGYLQGYENPEHLDMAIALFERALREDPLYAPTYAGLGEAYWHKYQATRNRRWAQLADSNCSRAIRLDEQLIPAHLNLATIHAGRVRYQDAVGEFQKVLKIDSLNVEAYRGLAKAYQALEQNGQAESTYLKAIKVRPNYPPGYSHLGAFYSRLGLYKKAAAQFEWVVALAPDNYKAYYNLGGVYAQLGRSVDAKRAFERSLEIQPNLNAYSNLATLYFFEGGSYAEAARMYEKARDLDSSDYRVWGNLASAYYWAPGERARADTAYRRAAEMAEEKRRGNPQDAALLSHLANYYAMLGKAGNAIPLLKQSLSLAPADPEVMAGAAVTYEQLGQRGKALEWIGKALKKGYPLKTVEQSPGLNELRRDARFLPLSK